MKILRLNMYNNFVGQNFSWDNLPIPSSIDIEKAHFEASNYVVTR